MHSMGSRTLAWRRWGRQCERASWHLSFSRPLMPENPEWFLFYFSEQNHILNVHSSKTDNTILAEINKANQSRLPVREKNLRRKERPYGLCLSLHFELSCCLSEVVSTLSTSIGPQDLCWSPPFCEQAMQVPWISVLKQKKQLVLS
jgi:hypothetical protein